MYVCTYVALVLGDLHAVEYRECNHTLTCLYSGTSLIRHLCNPTILWDTITILKYGKRQSIIRQPSNPTLFSGPIECRIREGSLYKCVCFCATLLCNTMRVFMWCVHTSAYCTYIRTYIPSCLCMCTCVVLHIHTSPPVVGCLCVPSHSVTELHFKACLHTHILLVLVGCWLFSLTRRCSPGICFLLGPHIRTYVCSSDNTLTIGWNVDVWKCVLWWCGGVCLWYVETSVIRGHHWDHSRQPVQWNLYNEDTIGTAVNSPVQWTSNPTPTGTWESSQIWRLWD